MHVKNRYTYRDFSNKFKVKSDFTGGGRESETQRKEKFVIIARSICNDGNGIRTTYGNTGSRNS